jgi:SAM-dependent methyltransferase
MDINDYLKFWENDGWQIAAYYQQKIKEEGFNPKGLAERSKIKENRFYETLFKGLEFSRPLSVLDVGSGLGDLIPFLKTKGIHLSQYLGIDLVPEFIKHSGKKYHNCQFSQKNLISPSFTPDRKFDLVVCIGALISKVSYYDEYVKYSIEKMVALAKQYVLLTLIIEIDPSSPNYSRQNEIGGVIALPEKTLIKILNEIKANKKISYTITKKRVYRDATDAFIKIKVD